MTFRFRRNLILLGVAVVALAALILTVEIDPHTTGPATQRSFPAQLTGVTPEAIGMEPVQSTPSYTKVLFERKGGAENQVKASPDELMADVVNPSPADIAVPVDPSGDAVDSGKLLAYNGRTAELGPFSIAASYIGIEATRTFLGSESDQLFADSSASSTWSADAGGALAMASGGAGVFGPPGYIAASSQAQTHSNSPTGPDSATTSALPVGGEQALNEIGSNPNSPNLTNLDQSSAPPVLSLSLAPSAVFAAGRVWNLPAAIDPGPGHGPSTSAGGQKAATVSTLLPPPPHSSMAADVARSRSASASTPFIFGGGGGGSSTFAASTFLSASTLSPDALTATPEPASAVLVFPVFAIAALMLRRRRIEKIT